MEFTWRKLPRSAAAQLKRNAIDTVKPFALLLSPVYVFLRANAKFLAIKGPLDFFTAEELERMKEFGTFFVSPFVVTALPFRDAAKSVRLTLSWRPLLRARDVEGESYPEVPLPPAPYELSDAVLRIVGPLWGAGGVIEPYFITVFSHEVCDALPQEYVKQARDTDMIAYEDSLFLSSWAVFLALHLGRCDLGYLSKMRAQIFASAFESIPFGMHHGPMDPETRELVALAAATMGSRLGRIEAKVFEGRNERLAQMLASRMRRVMAEFVRKDRPAPTIYGEKGLIDEAVR